MAGSLAASIAPATVTVVLFETHFGVVWCWHLLLAITVVLVCLAQPRRRQPIILVISLLLQSNGAPARRRALARRAGAVKMASSQG